MENHTQHDFSPLDKVIGPQPEKIAEYTIDMTKREDIARQAITVFDGALSKIEDFRAAKEKEVAECVALMPAIMDARLAELLQQIHDQGDDMRKRVMKERERQSQPCMNSGSFAFLPGGCSHRELPMRLLDYTRW